MIDVRRLRVLREVALSGSVSVAASVLGYTPSAVSQQIAALERETGGFALLERRGRGITLTPRAQVLVKHANIVLAQLERAEADLLVDTARLDGTLRLAGFATALHGLVPDALTELAAVAPDVSVHVIEAEPDQALPALMRHDLDLVIAFDYDLVAGPRLTALHQRELLVDPLLVVGLPGEPTSEPVALDELAEQRWLLPPEDTYCGQLVRRACEAAGFQPEPVATSRDFGALAAMAVTGLGVAMVPALALTPATLRRSRPLAPGLVRRLFAAVRDGAEENPLVAAALAALCRAATMTLGQQT